LPGPRDSPGDDEGVGIRDRHFKMSLNGIDSRTFAPPMVWDLEHNRIVNLKENFDPWDSTLELECTSKAHLCDSALRSPGDCLAKKGINSVKIYDSISELIADRARAVNRTLNPLVPISDSWMEVIKPTSLTGFAYGDGPSNRGVKTKRPSRAQIIGCMDEPLEGIV